MRKITRYSAACFAILFLLIGTDTSPSPKPQAWIVLEFTLSNGTPAQMAFNNPSNPNITESECKKSLPEVQRSLIEAAIQKEPRLAKAKFVSVRCVMSVDDPIKPK